MTTDTAKRKKSKPIRFMSDAIMAELARSLMDNGKVNQAQVNDLNTRKALTGDGLDILLIRESLVAEADVLTSLSEITGIPRGTIADFSITPETAARIPVRAALRYKVIPLAADDASLTLATSRVPDQTSVDSLRMLLGCTLHWALCTERDIEQSLKHFYGLGAETIDDVIKGKDDSDVQIEETDLALDKADPGVVKFVNQIVYEAIKMDATDIHIEPFEGRLRLRYRVDGLLQNIPVPGGIQRIQKAIASCVKIMAQMNIAERRKPHDGRIKVRIGDEEFDLRVSVLPTRFGETVNMRILSRKSMFISMDRLGLMDHQRPLIEGLTALPHGIILLTGPTGSGKTTSLYAMLSRINTEDVKIITVEDPVEYHLDGINQIQVHSDIGLTFGSALRSILRHDPDIILIGEVRDRETADIAVRASLTGHLVFSTLHTNDAPSAVARLVDMGVEPYLVSSCLEGVVAQRLVRRVCSKCCKPSTPDKVIVEEITETYPEEMKTATFMTTQGCPECSFSGYRGRIAICEIMVLDDDIRMMIARQRTSAEIRNKAMEKGLVNLRRTGWIRAMQGVTTVEEVMRVARKVNMPLALQETDSDIVD